jgi:hypothetical protein
MITYKKLFRLIRDLLYNLEVEQDIHKSISEFFLDAGLYTALATNLKRNKSVGIKHLDKLLNHLNGEYHLNVGLEDIMEYEYKEENTNADSNEE